MQSIITGKHKVFELEDSSKSDEVAVPSLIRKLEKIVLPKINFTEWLNPCDRNPI